MEKLIKNVLKKVRLNESTISTLLGAVVILTVGVLIFNYFKNSSQSEISPEGLEDVSGDEEIEFIKTKEGEMVPANLPIKHKVQKGEDLWKIAEKYYGSGYNWVDIASENSLANPDMLAVDQELVVPQVGVKKPVVQKEQTMVTQKGGDSKVISGTTYTVQKGEYLWNIAVRAYGDGYRWPDIAKENNLANPDLIEIGQELKLPR